MSPPRWACAVVAGAAGVLLAGCSAETSGTPAPTSAPSEPGAPSASGGVAPDVRTPLQPGRYLQQPCALLTSDQVNQLGVADDNGGDDSRSDPAGAQCGWTEAGTGLGVVWESTNRGGLDDIYAQRDYLEYFEPTQVQGFPAVFASALDSRSTGDCVLHVGVNAQDVFFVKFKAPDPPLQDRSCQQARRAAGWVLDTLRKGR